MAESWITKCGSRLICELLPEKEILYVIPISSSSILGKLPTVHAGDTGTIPYQHSGTNRFSRNIARADSAQGGGNDSPIYFVNSWAALGWSCDM